MKHILLEIINNDTSYNKSATRYLYKSCPDLWQRVIEQTNFLPQNAMPKQRIWHILNDVWAIPKCPITGQEVKWWENRYLETSGRTAKIRHQHLRGDFKNSFTNEINEKRKQGNLNAVKSGRKYRSKDTYTEQQKEKQRQTFLKKYGVDNPSKHPKIRKQLSDIQIQNGATPKNLRSLKQLYYESVKYFTKVSWRDHFDKINPNRLNRSELDLDHIYSKHQGFKDSIPPYIIGHWTNLRMLDKKENSSKGKRCDKTQSRLLEDFFANID
jgi:hypothetical protein